MDDELWLSEEERDALRAHWLGAPLAAEFAGLMRGDLSAADPRERHRRRAALAYYHSLTHQTVQHTNRTRLMYGPTAVRTLGELMQGDNAELARRAAVDLLREFAEAARAELVAETAAREEDRCRMIDQLTDEQVARMWEILGEAGESVKGKG